ncbi:hypothetical protein SETIT_9G134200v2 [Setaria italica]|uniref:Uncharacterized protein n=1 Tax=Setaria italica TaxID=4555 RepID=A0A368SG56_SETIT|nr:hypothetical protein SETIT_9G134200v2 [Setaria italica]
MSWQRSRTSSASYMTSLSSLTQPSVALSRMRFLSASPKMSLRSRSVVSSLVTSPGTPRSISTSSFTMPARMPTSLDANSSSSSAMVGEQETLYTEGRRWKITDGQMRWRGEEVQRIGGPEEYAWVSSQ